MERKHTTITIPTTLFGVLEERMEKTGFSSVSAYATYILRETMTRMMENDIKQNKNKEKILSKMEKLGYI
jgi:hypothetical protein